MRSTLPSPISMREKMAHTSSSISSSLIWGWKLKTTWFVTRGGIVSHFIVTKIVHSNSFLLILFWISNFIKYSLKFPAVISGKEIIKFQNLVQTSPDSTKYITYILFQASLCLYVFIIQHCFQCLSHRNYIMICPWLCLFTSH